jgi:hypothetical protein
MSCFSWLKTIVLLLIGVNQQLWLQSSLLGKLTEVSKVTGYGLDVWGSHPGREFSLFTPFLVQVALATDGDPSHPSSTWIQTAWSSVHFTFKSLHSMVVRHTDAFTLLSSIFIFHLLINWLVFLLIRSAYVGLNHLCLT